jgi:hypothetical protein
MMLLSDPSGNLDPIEIARELRSGGPMQSMGGAELGAERL